MDEDLDPDERCSPRKWKTDDPRRLRMAEKRASILQAAQPILLRDGLGGATLDRVAAEGGISKMTLYRHFPSKEALFEGLVVAMCTEMREGIQNAPSLDAAQSCRERLVAELRAFVHTLIEPNALALYRLVVAEGWRLESVSRAFDEAGMRVIRQRIAVLLRNGGVPKAQAPRIAGEVVALALGDAYQRAILGTAKAGDGAAFARQIDVAVAHAFCNCG